jgi:hypothetical protein
MNYSNPSPPPVQENPRNRLEEYGEKLLSLEMDLSQDIDVYNAKYLRYCTAAKIDLNEQSLKRRYLQSLLPKYRNILTLESLHKQSLEQVMRLMSNTMKGTEEVKPMTRIQPYDVHDSHVTPQKLQQQQQLQQLQKQQQEQQRQQPPQPQTLQQQVLQQQQHLQLLEQQRQQRLQQMQQSTIEKQPKRPYPFDTDNIKNKRSAP